MNFFKSVFTDDPETESEPDSPKPTQQQQHEQTEQNQDHESDTDNDNGWSFGGLMKTIQKRSESVIETYRKDLEEFGTGLKNEIQVAQGSVGHVIDELGTTVLKNTAEIISQGKEAILAAGNDSDSSTDNNSNISRRDSFSSKPYSRFDAQVRVIQGDVSTYVEEPEDVEDYRKWVSEFVIDGEKCEELFEENGEMRGVYRKVVPGLVDGEGFWFRYFYKVYKLKQAEDLRAELVERAISLDDEEELSWDIDDEEEVSEKVVEGVRDLKVEGNEGTVGEKSVKEEVTSVDLVSEKSVKEEVTSGDSVADKSVKEEVTSASVKEEVTSGSVKDEVASADSVTEESNAEEKKEVLELKTVVNESTVQDSDKHEDVPESDETVQSQVSGDKPDVVVSSSTQAQPSEEDLGWDEIEDMSTIDGDKEPSRSSGSPNRAELRKRLSVAEEDEDLSWDIEDDDEQDSSSKA